jgi:hypothetical protein
MLTRRPIEIFIVDLLNQELGVSHDRLITEMSG